MDQWLNWFNRGKITVFISSIALIAGIRFPWYSLPTEGMEAFGANLALANSVRFFGILFVLISLAFSLGFRISRITRLFFWSSLFAILLYPYFIKTWDPTVTFLAKSYEEQAQRVTLHVESNFHQVQSQWKQNIVLAQSRPISSISGLLIEDSRFFQVSSWEQVIKEFLGYNYSFFTFIGRGWSFTVMGLALALLGFYIGLEQEQLDVFVKDMGRILPGVVLLLCLIISSVITVNFVNHRLDTMFVKGEYDRVIALSQTLEDWYPPLQGDEAFLERLAKAGLYDNHPDLALVSFVQGLERYRLDDYQKAEEYFHQALKIQPKFFLARGYLATTIINQGVDYFTAPFVPNRPLTARFPYKYDYLDSPRSREGPNNSKASGTEQRCLQTLQVFPNHIEALYNLMLARVVNREFNTSALAAQQIIDMQKYFQQPMLALVGQAYLHLSWEQYQEGALTQAWGKYLQSVGSKSWNDSPDIEQ